MATLTIKNVPEKLHKRLKQSAAEHRRSLNKEVVVCLERALLSTKIDPEEFLSRIRAHRPQNVFVTDEDLRAFKNWGRP